MITQSSQSKASLELEIALSSSNMTTLHQASLNFAAVDWQSQEKLALPSSALICVNSKKLWNNPACCQEILKLAPK